MGHSRAQIRLDRDGDIAKFITAIMEEQDTFAIENADGKQCVSAGSMLGLLYAQASWSQIYLFNMTNDGEIPPVFDKFRVA